VSPLKAIVLLALLRGLRSGGVIGAVDFSALEQKMKDTAAADDAAREKRTQEANDKLDDWGKAVDHVVPGGGTYIAKLAKLALAIEGAIVRWVQGDWNSDEQKARALNAVKDAILAGVAPKSFDSEIDFAKTYADDLYGDISRTTDLGAYNDVFADYVATLHAHANDPLVASAFAGAAGAFSYEFGTPFLCGAIENPGRVYGLANLLAALASVRDGRPLSSALATAYAALDKLKPLHPTICTGRGHKGSPDSWDYSHGPSLYVLQAWTDLHAAAGEPHAAPSIEFVAPSPSPAPTPVEKLRKLAPLLLYFL
jgi:hypothetical protein